MYAYERLTGRACEMGAVLASAPPAGNLRHLNLNGGETRRQSSGEGFNLRAWAAEHADTFEIVNRLKERSSDVLRGEPGVKQHIECPFEHQHTEPGGSGCFAVNASQIKDAELTLRGRAFSEKAERIASRIAGGLLFALAAYVLAAAAWCLWRREGEVFSWPGLVVTVLAIPVMYLLAKRKLAIAGRIGSRALRADAVESITCGWLAFVVVVGLLVQLALGAWWVDSVTSLAILWFLIKDAREAWAGEACCDDD
jgi:Cation efflux family